MIAKSPFCLLLLIVCGASFQSTAVSQQFRSSRRASVNLPSVSPELGPGTILGVADFNGDGRPDFLTFVSSDPGGNFQLDMTLFLQKSDGSFAPHKVSNVPVGFPTVADADGDGKPDILMTISGPTGHNGVPLGQATLNIFRGNGDATFTAQPAITLAQGIGYNVFVADLNNDKKPDIIAVSGDQYADVVLETFLNRGGGKFVPGPVYDHGVVGGNILASGDFNEDGNLDLVIENNFEIQILLGKGDGSFSPGATYNTITPSNPAGPLIVEVGDLNRDRHQDLVVVNATHSQILLGKGDGTFAQGQMLATSLGVVLPNDIYGGPLFNVDSAYVGDLNKDGILDLAVTSTSSTTVAAVYYGKGDGSFGNAKIFNLAGTYGSGGSSAFADFNRDGRIDVLSLSSSAGYTIAYGRSDGEFDVPIVSQAPNAGTIAKGDFNGDGIEDVAVIDQPLCSTCAAGTVRVFPGTGKGFLGSPKTYAIPVFEGTIAAGDVNGDGKVDLVVARNPAQFAQSPTKTPDLSVLIGRGDGTFEAPKSYTLLGVPPITTFSSSVYLIDVNHDGKLDLVGDWGVALGKGNGEFQKPISLPSGIKGIMALAPGDFDGSGNVGLAIATNNHDTLFPETSIPPSYVYVLSGDGKGAFHISSKKSVDLLVTLTTADLNEDGLSDILYTTSVGNEFLMNTNLHVALNRGQGTFATTNYPLPDPTGVITSVLTGDFNRDGKTDVVVFGLFENGGDVALLLGTGGGALNKTPQYYQGLMGSGVVLDVNGDSAPDIAGTTTIGVARLLNTGHR
jgi:FG-GAP-like repeat